VVGQLENNTPLSARYRDHELKGEFAGIRECHIKDNILLMYRKEKDILVLLLVDIGTHPSLFK
jgi:mRNA interferase YafQ